MIIQGKWIIYEKSLSNKSNQFQAKEIGYSGYIPDENEGYGISLLHEFIKTQFSTFGKKSVLW